MKIKQITKKHQKKLTKRLALSLDLNILSENIFLGNRKDNLCQLHH
jgi:hypothetical protein